MNLVLQELERHQRGEQIARENAVAAEARQFLAYVPPAIEAHMIEKARPFLTFCAERGVSHLPARPETVAAFLLSHVDISPAIDRILEILDAIEAMHDAHSLASPVRSSIVAAALARWPRCAPPRSWPNSDKFAFLQLPLMVQHVIARRETQRDRELRRLQAATAPLSDAKLIEIATMFRRDTLAGEKSDCQCFAVSLPLMSLLNAKGVKAEVRTGIAPVDTPYHHYWIELDDGRVLDATADQFNGQCDLTFPEVYLGEPTMIHVPGGSPASTDASLAA